MVRPDWLAKRREAALEPDLPIVDPHHHLIDRPESGTYLLPFPCCFADGEWRNSATGGALQATVIGWRLPRV